MMHSDGLDQIAPAMVALQGKLRSVTPEKKNKHLGNKYADLASVMQAIREPMHECGLAISQAVGSGGGGVTICTKLLHTSGQWIASTIEIPLGQAKGVSDAQRMGSAITYGRRYSVLAIIGGTVADDDDDGGNAGTKTQQEKPAVSPSQQIIVDSFIDELDLLIEKAEVQKWGKDKAEEIGKLSNAAANEIRKAYREKLQEAK